MAKILVVDDDQGMRDYLEIMLSREGYDVNTSPGGKEALALCRKRKFDLVITDLKMSGMDGIGLLKSLKEISPEVMIILITGYASGETALAAMKGGAYDYLEKNFEPDDLKNLVKEALSKKGVGKEDAQFMKDVKSSPFFGKMTGKSEGMMKVYKDVKKTAETVANVLILGESGTGKELVARAIHENSSRKDGPFVVINCGGIPENLLESELFGYMKGSFTGAYADKAGLFEVAHGGTIFLDEIGELSPFLQVKLLRVVQEKTFRRVGGSRDISVDVRIISATNQNLEERVKSGGFREDLFYRLNVIPLKVPPLRERKEDIPPLVDHFLEKYSREYNKEIKKISPYAMSLLVEYPFPGNVRELENIIERSVALETTNIILPENLEISEAGDPPLTSADDLEISEEGLDLNEEVAKFEKNLMKKALQKAGGSKTKAAKLLKVSLDSLRYRLDK
ncbi:MAG: sigma-54-dependent Fis family transcriptional regulator [Deltaproteobacteria bacterium]|nr:sigma-54-dependent Fis family transcriptional regulator [Deltaproteobacteria bacterium]MBW2595196.1 sigma-54-dependent Fis family transcriptional regulator [Deltaproteobacteria bacterium]